MSQVRVLGNLDLTLVGLGQPTIMAVENLPSDAAPGTIIFDESKQRLRLRVVVNGQHGWLTINASGFSPDPE
jgi:hypothetical protein